MAYRLQRSSSGEDALEDRSVSYVASTVGDRSERHSTDHSIDHGESSIRVRTNQKHR